MASIPPSKCCTKCGDDKPLDQFSTHRNTADGLRPDCRACVREYDRARREANPEYNRQRCRAWADSHRAEKAESGRLYREQNREAILERKRQYYSDNRDRILDGMRRHYLANRDVYFARHRKWRSAHQEYVRQWRRMYYQRTAHIARARVREWKRLNPEKYKALNSRHKAMRRGAAVGDAFTRAEIWTRDGGICHLCHKRCDPNDWHLDHLVPVSLGGEHSRANVAVSHPVCNIRRSNRGPAQLRLLG